MLQRRPSSRGCADKVTNFGCHYNLSGWLLLDTLANNIEANETEIYPRDYLFRTRRSFDVLGGPFNDRFIRFIEHLLAGG
jgi:hypothetical protein